MPTPMTKAETISVLDDAIAFEKAADRSGLSPSDARRFAAALGALPAEQLTRICAFAREHQLTTEARLRRKRSGR